MFPHQLLLAASPGTIWQLHIQDFPGLESRPACFRSAWIPGGELYPAGGTLLSPPD